MKKMIVSALAVLFLCFVYPDQSYAVPRYNVVDLGTTPDYTGSKAVSINNLGQVLVRAYRGWGTEETFVWYGGQISILPIRGMDINDAGQVAGHLLYFNTAAIYDSGSIIRLESSDGLPDLQSLALSINNLGQAVGRAAGHAQHAWIWDTGSMLDLTPMWAAYDVNDGGIVVGTGVIDATIGSMQAIMWSRTDGFRDLGSLRADDTGSSSAMAINSLGHVVGYADADNAERRRGFIWRNGQMTEIAALPGNAQTAYIGGINRWDQVVGWNMDGLATERAFLWEGGVTTDLNHHIDPASGWILNEATAINDSGWIVGAGKHNGLSRGYLLIPVPEPCSLLALLPGLATVGAGLVRQWSQRSCRK